MIQESEPQAKSSSTRKSRRHSRSLSGIGFEFASTLAGACLLGYWIGKRFGKAELGVVIGASLGLVAALLSSVQAALRVSKNAQLSARDQPARGEGKHSTTDRSADTSTQISNTASKTHVESSTHARGDDA